MRKLLAVIGLSALLFGCGGDDAGGNVNIVSNNGSSDNGQSSNTEQLAYVWDATVTSQEIKFSGSVKWSAKSDDNCKNWCYPVKSSDTSDKIVLWVSPNITNKARSGKVTIQYGGKTQEISVSQPAFTGNLDEYDYHLPVIFHVMYKNKSDKTQYPDKSQFTKILNAVNKLYADNQMHIVFEMAKYNDDGDELEEPGIIRKEVDFDELSADDFFKDEDYSDDVQNLKKYINIFVFRFAQTSEETTTLGYSSQPILPTDYKLDLLVSTDATNDYAYLTTPFGVCINNKYINEWQDEGYVKTTYIVSTVAHELGHYIGLLHTFSEQECEEDDGCDDTHISDYENYISYIEKYQNDEIAKGRDPNTFTFKELGTRTDCKTGEEFLADNIMDYAYTLSDVFTAQQKARTRHVLKYGSLVPGPKLIDYNTTGIVTKQRAAGRRAALLPGMVQTDPCPPMPVRHLYPAGLK